MPKTPHPVDELSSLLRRFDREAATRKEKLLDEIAATRSLSAKRIILLHDTLYFMRAYPDNPAVLQAVRRAIASMRRKVDEYTGGDVRHHAFANTGLPAGHNTYEYSYASLLRLAKMFPGATEIDWDAVGDTSVVGDALMQTIASAEVRGLEDEFVSLQEWLQDCKSSPTQTDLEAVLLMFRQSSLEPQQQEHVFETCQLPIVYALSALGSGRCELSVAPDEIAYQSRPIAKERFPLRPRILERLGKRCLLSPAAGGSMIDLATAALCSRNLEIHPLLYANPTDVTVVESSRGLQVVLVGMLPEFRPSLESTLFFMILKNGVPIGYGPVSIFLGCCEMGINLFEEFRGGEIRYIYAQFMRPLYHAAHVRYFFVTSYGMGEGNPEALKSGAFWFYRKLGFRASNPDVEALARREENIMRRRPSHRSSMKMLRELSYTDVYFDMSAGACTPLNFGAVSRAVSRSIATRFHGDRRRAAIGCAKAVADAIGIEDFRRWTREERASMRRMAPVLSLLPGLDTWAHRDRDALAGIIKAKVGPSDLEYLGATFRHPRLARALHALADETR